MKLIPRRGWEERVSAKRPALHRSGHTYLQRDCQVVEFITADLGRWICMVIQASSNLRNVPGLLSLHCVTWSHWGWVDRSCGRMSFVSATPCCFRVKILIFQSKYCLIKKWEKWHIYVGVAKSVGISYRYLNSGHLEVTDLFWVPQRAERGRLSQCFTFQMTLLVIGCPKIKPAVLQIPPHHWNQDIEKES